VRAGAQLLAVVAVSYYVVRLAMLGRGVLMALIPLGVAFTLLGRMGAAAGLHLARRRGHARRTAVVVGDEAAVGAVVNQVDRTQAPAITVAGVVIIDGQSGEGRSRRGGPSSNGNGQASGQGNGDGQASGRGNGNGQGRGRAEPDPRVVVRAVADTGAETVIIAGTLSRDRLRDIAWRLEGTGVDLLVTPGPRRGEMRPSPHSPVPRLALPHPDA
jgi:hypothetical protein